MGSVAFDIFNEKVAKRTMNELRGFLYRHNYEIITGSEMNALQSAGLVTGTSNLVMSLMSVQIRFIDHFVTCGNNLSDLAGTCLGPSGPMTCISHSSVSTF